METPRHCPDGVTTLEGGAVEGFPTDTGLDVPCHNASLLYPETGKEISNAVAIHIVELRAVRMGRRGGGSPLGAEGQRCGIYVDHVEGVGAKNRHPDLSRARRMDGVIVGPGLDVNRDGGDRRGGAGTP